MSIFRLGFCWTLLKGISWFSVKSKTAKSSSVKTTSWSELIWWYLKFGELERSGGEYVEHRHLPWNSFKLTSAIYNKCEDFLLLKNREKKWLKNIETLLNNLAGEPWHWEGCSYFLRKDKGISTVWWSPRSWMGLVLMKSLKILNRLLFSWDW